MFKYLKMYVLAQAEQPLDETEVSRVSFKDKNIVLSDRNEVCYKRVAVGPIHGPVKIVLDVT